MQKYYKVFEEKGTNEHNIGFESGKLGEWSESKGHLCMSKLAILSDPFHTIQCPFDSSTFDPGLMNSLCPTCELCSVGQNTLGLRLT